MKVFHLNILATKADVDELNRVGWDGHPRFTMHADITSGDLKAATAGFSEGAYKHVATMGDELNLEDAFRLTNHIETEWQQNPEVTPAGDDGQRSTSVGDLIEKDGDVYMVAGFGFEKLEGVTA